MEWLRRLLGRFGRSVAWRVGEKENNEPGSKGSPGVAKARRDDKDDNDGRPPETVYPMW
jgi:hypothetical protein